ncbi:MAG: histone H1 [Bacteroidota bacterium]|nr:histone H1 [Candidatus Kapabacteria bacterium]MCS7303286.1 histone H1 [Candidatus Kapabacteria bacterium]MDW8075048.1 histone H1 [Bacteroidota bacterium]
MPTDRYQELISHIEAMKEDFEKFYTKGKNAAGTRLRKQLQQLRRLAQEIRTEIQAIRVARKSSA